MMRFLLLAIILFPFAFQVASAQEPAVDFTDPSLRGWRTVLEPGTLETRPDIVTVDSGFAISAESFIDPIPSFNSDWLFYDPASERWSSYGVPHEPSQRVNINHLQYLHPEIANMFPEDAEPEIQFVDGDRKAVFLVDAGENLADHTYYFGVKFIDLATGVVTKLNIWSCWGVRRSDAIVWEFPDENLIVSCDMLIWHDGDSIRKELMSSYIGQGSPSMLHLLSTSPNNRYWILRERFHYDPWYGDYYLYDRQTGWTTILLWRDWRMPYHVAVWLSDSTLVVNEGDFVMYFDTEDYEHRLALADELRELPDAPAHWLTTYLSLDGQWLLVPTEGGGLVLRNVFDSLSL